MVVERTGPDEILIRSDLGGFSFHLCGDEALKLADDLSKVLLPIFEERARWADHMKVFDKMLAEAYLKKLTGDDVCK